MAVQERAAAPAGTGEQVLSVHAEARAASGPAGSRIDLSDAQTLTPCSLRKAWAPFLFMVRRARAVNFMVTVRPSSGR